MGNPDNVKESMLAAGRLSLQQDIDRIAELESKLATVLKDQSDADTYIRNAAMKVLSDKEVNGDEHGVPPIENIVDALVMEIKARDRLMRPACICHECIYDNIRGEDCKIYCCKVGMIAFAKRELEKEGKDATETPAI